MSPFPANGYVSSRADMGTIARWVTLGAAAGGLGGVLVGGVLGRLAMFILRLTSHDSARGVESDDGFIIGRFGIVDTAQLVIVTGIMGTLFGLVLVAGRPFFPKRWMPIAWAVAGAIVGGAVLINSDGVDFAVLGPGWLAAAMFIALPAAGCALIACLVELYQRFWWTDRKRTFIAAPFGAFALPFFPVAVLAVIVGFFWWLTMRFPRGRRFAQWRPARIAAIAVFGIILLMGSNDLTRDLQKIL